MCAQKIKKNLVDPNVIKKLLRSTLLPVIEISSHDQGLMLCNVLHDATTQVFKLCIAPLSEHVKVNAHAMQWQ
jgi:hypothetical protein